MELLDRLNTVYIEIEDITQDVVQVIARISLHMTDYGNQF
jgi:hypothetical protein